MDKPTKSPFQVNYKAPERISEEEKSLIRNTFKDNDVLLNVLKKILLPSYTDDSTPFEMSGADVFSMGRDWASMPTEEVKALVVARQDTINFIAGALTWLKITANEKAESEQELSDRRTKDSLK